MKTAYLYIRVSTDEQKRRGYSLPEQEDRLLKYCEFNNIEVKGIFREDYSAKTFNRPEWKKLITVIKSRSSKDDKSILFIKWDRFSRNIENAYEMIGMLRKHKTTAMAIDQPIDFSVPESTVMLAVYLSVPEAENSRRAMNTANGIRRAKLMGRYPGKAPLGFINLTTVDGKKVIVPKQPEAGIIKWVFHQLAKNIHRVEDVRRMADDKGLKCSRSYFFKLIRNPAYCGLIPIKLSSREQHMVKGIHDPLIAETLFYEVQRIILTKTKTVRKTDNLKATFFLTGFLTCPLCGRKMLGSFSQGSRKNTLTTIVEENAKQESVLHSSMIATNRSFRNWFFQIKQLIYSIVFWKTGIQVHKRRSTYRKDGRSKKNSKNKNCSFPKLESYSYHLF